MTIIIGGGDGRFDSGQGLEPGEKEGTISLGNTSSCSLDSGSNNIESLEENY